MPDLIMPTNHRVTGVGSKAGVGLEVRIKQLDMGKTVAAIGVELERVTLKDKLTGDDVKLWLLASYEPKR